MVLTLESLHVLRAIFIFCVRECVGDDSVRGSAVGVEWKWEDVWFSRSFSALWEARGVRRADALHRVAMTYFFLFASLLDRLAAHGTHSTQSQRPRPLKKYVR